MGLLSKPEQVEASSLLTQTSPETSNYRNGLRVEKMVQEDSRKQIRTVTFTANYYMRLLFMRWFSLKAQVEICLVSCLVTISQAYAIGGKDGVPSPDTMAIGRNSLSLT